jgi:hypothetical protein
MVNPTGRSARTYLVANRLTRQRTANSSTANSKSTGPRHHNTCGLKVPMVTAAELRSGAGGTRLIMEDLPGLLVCSDEGDCARSLRKSIW